LEELAARITAAIGQEGMVVGRATGRADLMQAELEGHLFVGLRVVEQGTAMPKVSKSR
jgi:hypothetical protein